MKDACEKCHKPFKEDEKPTLYRGKQYHEKCVEQEVAFEERIAIC